MHDLRANRRRVGVPLVQANAADGVPFELARGRLARVNHALKREPFRSLVPGTVGNGGNGIQGRPRQVRPKLPLPAQRPNHRARVERADIRRRLHHLIARLAKAVHRRPLGRVPHDRVPAHIHPVPKVGEPAHPTTALDPHHPPPVKRPPRAHPRTPPRVHPATAPGQARTPYPNCPNSPPKKRLRPAKRATGRGGGGLSLQDRPPGVARRATVELRPTPRAAMPFPGQAGGLASIGRGSVDPRAHHARNVALRGDFALRPPGAWIR